MRIKKEDFSMLKKMCSLLLTVAMLVTIALPLSVFAESSDMPLVAGIQTLSEKFSPFFYETGYDRFAYILTQETLMTMDRSGGIVYNAIEGETIPYNGVDYTYSGIADISVKYDEASDITTYTASSKKGSCSPTVWR
jgi:peptide/nickel transport system substrate-binding protein